MVTKATEQAFTTSDLRLMLLDAINKVQAGEMNRETAGTIAKLSAEIIKTADLELRFNKTLRQSLADGSEVDPGPVLLSTKK